MGAPLYNRIKEHTGAQDACTLSREPTHSPHPRGQFCTRHAGDRGCRGEGGGEGGGGDDGGDGGSGEEGGGGGGRQGAGSARQLHFALHDARALDGEAEHGGVERPALLAGLALGLARGEAVVLLLRGGFGFLTLVATAGPLPVSALAKATGGLLAQRELAREAARGRRVAQVHGEVAHNLLVVLEREEEVSERRVVVARESEHLLLAPAAHRGWHAAFARAAKGAVGRHVVQRRLGHRRYRAAVGARRRLGLLGDGGRATALLLLGLLGQ